jgi:hypothetical protein
LRNSFGNRLAFLGLLFASYGEGRKCGISNPVPTAQRRFNDEVGIAHPTFNIYYLLSTLLFNRFLPLHRGIVGA